MALEGTFRQLSVSLHKLHDALNALHVTVGDKPPNDEAALADGLENAVLDMMGTLHEARKSSMEARRAVGAPIDLDRARRSLTICQTRFHCLERLFSSDLVSYEKLKELARLGSARGREWLPWASSVKHGIEECRQPLQSVSVAIARCWQEIAEKLGTTNISVRTTTIGQQVSACVPEAAALRREADP